MKMTLFNLSFLVYLSILASCSENSSSKGPGNNEQTGNVEGTKADAIKAFASEAELNAHMAILSQEYQAIQQNKAATPSASGASPVEDAASSASNESITNNQESGVDEGGIVKNINDSLLVLRKGRIYVTSTANGLTQTDSLPVASDEALNQSVWYDELLVSGDRIYVIGYRYNTQGSYSQDLPVLSGKGSCQRRYYGATEINSFRLKDGKLQRLGNSFLESYDYFSGNNYSGRMVAGKLVFYMPQSAFEWCSGGGLAIKIPQQLSYEKDQGFKPVKPLFGATDISPNIESIQYSPIFHTMVSCALPEDGSLDCKAKAILGSYAREKYVSTNAVYLASGKRVYSLDLKDLSMRAHAFSGSPVDQFSFKESDGKLQVLVADTIYTTSDVAGGAAKPTCSTSLLSLPLAAFDASGQQDLQQARQEILKSDHCYPHKNRFIGNYLVFASTGSNRKSQLVSYDLKQGSSKTRELAGYVSRIEVLKDNLAFVSYQSPLAGTYYRNQLEVATVNLSSPDLQVKSLSLGEASEGESRSHGFFQKADADGSHVLGLPVIGNRSQPGSWWGNGLSNIAFMRVDAEEKISVAGAAESSGEQGICETSCIDWYGNTRPIFLGKRTFALMGSEIQELSFGGSGLEKVSAVQFVVEKK